MGFALVLSKPARVQYHAVVDRFVTYPALDPLAILAFAVAFIVTVLLVERRPGLAAAILAFATPFAFYASVARTTITLPKVLLFGAIVGLIPHLRDRARIFAGTRPIMLGFLAIIAAIALSSIHAADRGAVLREMLKWIEYGAFFCVAYASYAIDPRESLVKRAFFLSFAIVCVSALIQEVLGSPSGIDFGPGTVPRISGVLEGPNQLAAFLEVATAVVLAWSIEDGSLAARVLAALIGATLMLTFSRGGIFGAAVVVLVILWRKAAQARVRAILPFICGGALGALGDLAWSYAGSHVRALRNPRPGVDHSGGVGHRPELWNAALTFFRREPFTGIGAGNFETHLPAAGLYGVRTHANSWYLQSLAEGGLLLFGATLFFIGALVGKLLPLAYRFRWSLAALAATIALVIHQTVDYLVFYPKVAEPWIILCALGCVSQPERCD